MVQWVTIAETQDHTSISVSFVGLSTQAHVKLGWNQAAPVSLYGDNSSC